MKKSTSILLWALIAIYAFSNVVSAIFPQLQHPINIGLSMISLFAFALIHGSIRYGVRGIAVFAGVCLVVANCMENLSIMTGFPFGHYYYSSRLGPKLFLVPLLIGLAYFGTGYIAWTLANIFLGFADRRKDLISLLGLPIIAAFLMAGWDACLDPTNATVNKEWIWQNGGGYFGVPFGNYLGWYFTVYVFYQIFAFYASKNPAVVHAEKDKTYWLQAAVFFLVIALHFPATYFGAANTTVTDAVGRNWQTGDIYETSTIITIFTMIFASVLAFFKIAQMDQRIES
jgi:uncharacterized membrane protein